MSIGRPGEIGGEVEGFRLLYPHIHPYVIPRYMYRASADAGPGHPRDPVQTIAVPSLLVCRADLDGRVAREITRSIFDNRVALVKQHSAAGQIRAPSDLTALSYPLHKGADSYYRRHEPGFLVTYAEVIALLMSITSTALGGVIALRNWLRLRKKDRIDQYYVRISAILDRLRDDVPLSRDDMLAIEDELSGIRHQAVHELVEEKLQANESFRIFQTLLANSQREVRSHLLRIERET